jgi:tRNA pseudouridine32 synthase/23S rRNA pseudouridine746 synthase
VEAARLVREYLERSPLKDEVDEGKMLGVLVCLSKEGELGFLAAYSGQLGGRADWPWFVPAVFDYLQPDGYFKQEEAAISALNHRIEELERNRDEDELRRLQTEAEQEINAYKRLMAEAKARRDAQRGEADEASLIRESQFQKAELRRIKKRWAERINEAEKPLKEAEEAIATLKEERHHRSDALQRWLFDHFVMLNDRGERRTLTDIFLNTPQRTPPSGAGECCAPKLLQYAFSHELQPLAIAEFWQGRSPKQEIRHEGQFYTACRGKCKPILEWMLEEEKEKWKVESGKWKEDRWDAEKLCAEGDAPDGYPFSILHSSSSYLVINKPAGLLSVPGRTGEESVESLLQRVYPEVCMVHRLDQDTSGLMVVALNHEAYHQLQLQFLARTLSKKYIALVAPHSTDELPIGKKGTISLPLRPDIMDRPRQIVDFEHGKEAITDYEVLAHEGEYVRLSLTPHTGRTHQLRMHCAHELGLRAPIVGDRLYGKPARRLCLHAVELAFDDPLTGERLFFSSMVPF